MSVVAVTSGVKISQSDLNIGDKIERNTRILIKHKRHFYLN